MDTCRLVVRTPEGVWEEEVDSWTSLVVLAALSAEPESFAELAHAVRRYQPEHRLFEPFQPTGPWDGAGTDGPWCLIDLAGRTVVAGGGFELPYRRGAYEATTDHRPAGFPIVWLDTPADWRFQQADGDWRAAVAERASARAAAQRLDARAVLYGQPLLEHLAESILAATPTDTDDDRELEWTRAVHACWLLTARADLGGLTPREVLLAERDRIAWDLQHRSEQWSQQRHAPPALSSDSAAYRWGGYGTTEVVLYFDLVRALLAQAWELIVQDVRPTRPVLVQQLAAFRDGWLNAPQEATGPGLTPAQLIESERRRMPVTGAGSYLDCDCPICQAMTDEEFGPAFLSFDGHHLELEDEFAFSLAATREEWVREQEEYRKFSGEMDRKRLEDPVETGDADDLFAGPIWQSSFVDWDAMAGSHTSPRQALLVLGFPLAELGSALRGRGEGQDLLPSLNGAYHGLRTSQDPPARDSAAQEFRDALEAVSEKFPDLTSQCADLQSRLDEVLRGIS
jgi:hypothetical protein